MTAIIFYFYDYIRGYLLLAAPLLLLVAVVLGFLMGLDEIEPTMIVGIAFSLSTLAAFYLLIGWGIFAFGKDILEYIRSLF